MNRLKNITHYILSKNWATLYRIDYDFQFKDGLWKRLSRESYNRGNGTSILLYNTTKGTVVLTRQFRMPAYENDSNDGMSIEACAGALDNNEDPKTCIIREVEEEVGYVLKDVEQVLEAYMSPGAVTEKMYFFIGEYTEDMKLNEGGGLESENEEIEVIEIPFKTAVELVEKREIKDAKTIMLLQYAQIHSLV